MTDTIPRSIRRFEALQLASILIGSLNLAVVINATGTGWIEAFVGMPITLALTLLVSRGRRSWPRWVLAFLFSIGAAFMVWAVWNVPGLFAAGYPVLTVVASLLQTVALVL